MTNDPRARELLAWLDSEVEGAIMPPEKRQHLANAAALIRALASPQDVGERAALEECRAYLQQLSAMTPDDAQALLDRVNAALAHAQPEQEDDDGEALPRDPQAGEADVGCPPLGLKHRCLRHELSEPCAPPRSAAQPVDEGLARAERFGNAEYRKACSRPIPTILDSLTLGDRATLEAYANAEFWAGKLCGMLASHPIQGRKVREALERAAELVCLDCEMGIPRNVQGLHQYSDGTTAGCDGDKIRALASTPLDPPEDASFEAGQAEADVRLAHQLAEEAFEHQIAFTDTAVSLGVAALRIGRIAGLEAAKAECVQKAEQLLQYRDSGCQGDDEIKRHAWTVADARYRQCTQLAAAIDNLIQSSQGGGNG